MQFAEQPSVLAGKPRDPVSSAIGDDLERATVFGALRRFSFGAARRCLFIALPLALDRFFIVSLVG